MSEVKTVVNEKNPYEFIMSVENKQRKDDGLVLLDLFERVTGVKPKMWGPTIIGFGRCHYRYDSGREGDFMLAGFSPRKANLVVYTMPGYDDIGEHLDRLGKHKLGKSCLYINKLADVDLGVLEEIIDGGVATMRATYETWTD